jgi:hypothetical protein
MGVLMLKCPQTGREFSTGIHLEEDSFKRLPDTVTKAACPHCSQLHRWWTRDARLSDATEPTRRAGRPFLEFDGDLNLTLHPSPEVTGSLGGVRRGSLLPPEFPAAALPVRLSRWQPA